MKNPIGAFVAFVACFGSPTLALSIGVASVSAVRGKQRAPYDEGVLGVHG